MWSILLVFFLSFFFFADESYLFNLLTCQLPIETGQADGKGLEWAKWEAEVHGEHVWGYTTIVSFLWLWFSFCLPSDG